jgi:glutaredoxin
MVYTLSTCRHCKDVKKLLETRGVAYENVDVDLLEGDARKKTIAEVRRHNPKVTFPTTIIGDEVVVGNKLARLEEKLNEFTDRRA